MFDTECKFLASILSGDVNIQFAC